MFCETVWQPEVLAALPLASASPPLPLPAFSLTWTMAAGGSSANFVYIKLATAKEDTFAYLETGGLTAAQVAALACSHFSRWRLVAGQVRIHLVAEPGKEPSDEAISAALARRHLSLSARNAPDRDSLTMFPGSQPRLFDNLFVPVQALTDNAFLVTRTLTDNLCLPSEALADNFSALGSTH